VTSGSLPAVTLPELLSDPKMNPKRFANHFCYFEYEFHEEVQAPDVFLAREKGDCDDYACLADLVLKQKGLGTRLIQVQLVGRIDHAVCYVTESHAYLDYNNRQVFFTLTRSGPSLRNVATKVAASCEANWTSAFEFTYDGVTKEILTLVIKTAPPETDPVPGQKSGNSVIVRF
jgi:hypothetical protein